MFSVSFPIFGAFWAIFVSPYIRFTLRCPIFTEHSVISSPIEKSPTVAFIVLGVLSVGYGNNNPSSDKSLNADSSSKTITLKEEV